MNSSLHSFTEPRRVETARTTISSKQRNVKLVNVHVSLTARSGDQTISLMTSADTGECSSYLIYFDIKFSKIYESIFSKAYHGAKFKRCCSEELYYKAELIELI